MDDFPEQGRNKQSKIRPDRDLTTFCAALQTEPLPLLQTSGMAAPKPKLVVANGRAVGWQQQPPRWPKYLVLFALLYALFAYLDTIKVRHCRRLSFEKRLTTFR